jgi:hypothetical protein
MMLPRQNGYFPLANGRYETGPGLRQLGTDFGQGETDSQVFQFDDRFGHYRQVKLSGHYDNPDKYYVQHNLEPTIMARVVEFIIGKLCQESPRWFRMGSQNGLLQLECRLTDEILLFDPAYRLCELRGAGINDGANYQDGLDALMLQVQEDLALVQLDPKGQDYLGALHLSFPNFWSAHDKIGKNFTAIHEPVPGMDDNNRNASKLINAMIYKGPFVRFAWGITTDNKLNHHPDSESNDSSARKGRCFNPHNPELYLRVERQVMVGFTNLNATLFIIRTYLYDVANIIQIPWQRNALVSALQSMSVDTLNYKGLTESLPEILDWIANQ